MALDGTEENVKTHPHLTVKPECVDLKRPPLRRKTLINDSLARTGTELKFSPPAPIQEYILSLISWYSTHFWTPKYPQKHPVSMD